MAIIWYICIWWNSSRNSSSTVDWIAFIADSMNYILKLLHSHLLICWALSRELILCSCLGPVLQNSHVFIDLSIEYIDTFFINESIYSVDKSMKKPDCPVQPYIYKRNVIRTICTHFFPCTNDFWDYFRPFFLVYMHLRAFYAHKKDKLQLFIPLIIF